MWPKEVDMKAQTYYVSAKNLVTVLGIVIFVYIRETLLAKEGMKWLKGLAVMFYVLIDVKDNFTFSQTTIFTVINISRILEERHVARAGNFIINSVQGGNLSGSSVQSAHLRQ